MRWYCHRSPVVQAAAAPTAVGFRSLAASLESSPASYRAAALRCCFSIGVKLSSCIGRRAALLLAVPRRHRWQFGIPFRLRRYTRHVRRLGGDRRINVKIFDVPSSKSHGGSTREDGGWVKRWRSCRGFPVFPHEANSLSLGVDRN